MGSAFNNYISQKGQKIIKTFDHATKLYVDNNYAKSPKVAFLYFVGFNINKNALLDSTWKERYSDEVGLLVKKIDLPKFNIAVETLNQYNRKTAVQTKLTYGNVSIDFHDDYSDITNNLWINYYKHYYADSNYGGASRGTSIRDEMPPSYKDTKYGIIDYEYGRWGAKKRVEPFFSTIDLYVLYQHQYTQITLINPKITEWGHDNVNQADSARTLQNRMTVAYENVLYNQGIVEEENPEGFNKFYDKEYSPLSAKENPESATGGGNESDIFGKMMSSMNLPKIPDPSSLTAGLSASKNGLENTLSNPALNLTSSLFNASGKANDIVSNNVGQVFNSPGGVGINVFKGFNSGNNGTTPATPVNTGNYGGGI